MKLTWQDVDEIALDLVERYPQVDPLSVKFPELKTMVISLPSFEDDPDAATDAILESIQSAWYDEFED
ncbi:MAG TPA: Fe-S cluster assembly protein IscX [Bacteroidota bacterium]|nr:Fe-S cluster assembly protein IscX [Bacteroidota bacterium]